MKSKFLFFLLITCLGVSMLSACTNKGNKKPIEKRLYEEEVREPQVGMTPTKDMIGESTDKEKSAMNQIRNIPDVVDDTVVISGTNAYVAVTLKDGINNPRRVNSIESEVISIIKRIDKRVSKIHFSADEMIHKKLKEYEIIDIKNGTVINEIEDLFKSSMNKIEEDFHKLR